MEWQINGLIYMIKLAAEIYNMHQMIKVVTITKFLLFGGTCMSWLLAHGTGMNFTGIFNVERISQTL